MRSLVAIAVAAGVCCGALRAQPETRPLVKQAADLINAEQPAAALGILRQALELTPKNPDVHVYLGEAYFQLEKNDEAVAAFRDAIRIDASIAPFIQNLGHALLKLQRPAEAREHFQIVVDRTRSAPAKARALVGVGLALVDEGNEKLARARFEDALKADPALLRARYRLALIQMKAGENAAAVEHLRAVVAVDPLFEGAAYNLALGHRALGNDAAAKEWEERFKEVRRVKRELEDLKGSWRENPGRVELMAAIARVYSRAESYPDAIAWFTRYLAARPNDAAARAELAQARAKAGK